MHVFGLHILDWCIIGFFLGLILAIGAWMSRSVKSENDFYLGGRKLGKALQFFLAFGNITDSTGGPLIASEVFRQGTAGVWIGFQTLFITPFYWFMTVWFRRVRLVTMADLFIDRFDSQSLATAYALFSIFVALLGLGLGNVISYKVTAAMIIKPEAEYTAAERQSVADFREYEDLRSQYAAGVLSPEMKSRYDALSSMDSRGELRSFVSYVKPLPFYIAYTVVVAIYITLGGLRAAAVIDSFQGLLVLTFTILLIPLGLSRIGGFRGLHAAVPSYMFQMFGTVTSSEYTWYVIAAIWFTSLIQMFGLMHNMASSGSARNEAAARFGMITGGFTKRMVIVGWMLCGLMTVALFPQGVADPDNAWGSLSQLLLGPGLMGLMISGMLLGHMPSVGTNAIAVAALVTKNAYEPLVRNKTQKHYIRVGQLAIILVLAASIAVSTFFSGVLSLITMLITFNAFFGATVFLIFFWRKLTAPAIIVGLAIWVVFIGVVPYAVPQIAVLRQAHGLLKQTGEQTVQVVAGATQGDVLAGRASKAGEAIRKTQVIPPASVFFDSIARQDVSDPNSKFEGIGRFNFETFALSLLGMPVRRFGKAGLVAARWLFDGVFPFCLLISLSYLTHLFRGVGSAEAAALAFRPGDAWDEDETRRGVAVATRPARRRMMIRPMAVEQARADRFFVRLKTPVGASPEEDERQVAISYAAPHRFDHLKLFPHSDWEFMRWTRNDALGFLGCWAIVLAVLGVLALVLNIGR